MVKNIRYIKKKKKKLRLVSWEVVDSGSQTRVALCWSFKPNERSKSSGISAWYFEPTFMCLKCAKEDKFVRIVVSHWAEYLVFN